MAGHACTLLALLGFKIIRLWTFIRDGSTVINNVFPFWAIKYFNSGSLVWSAELKGASTVVVEGQRIFAAQNFPSSLKQHWVVTRWSYYVCQQWLVTENTYSILAVTLNIEVVLLNKKKIQFLFPSCIRGWVNLKLCPVVFSFSQNLST